MQLYSVSVYSSYIYIYRERYRYRYISPRPSARMARKTFAMVLLPSLPTCPRSMHMRTGSARRPPPALAASCLSHGHPTCSLQICTDSLFLQCSWNKKEFEYMSLFQEFLILEWFSSFSWFVCFDKLFNWKKAPAAESKATKQSDYEFQSLYFV